MAISAEFSPSRVASCSAGATVKAASTRRGRACFRSHLSICLLLAPLFLLLDFHACLAQAGGAAIAKGAPAAKSQAILTAEGLPPLYMPAPEGDPNYPLKPPIPQGQPLAPLPGSPQLRPQAVTKPAQPSPAKAGGGPKAGAESRDPLQLFPPVTAGAKGGPLMSPLPLKLSVSKVERPIDLEQAVEIAAGNYPKILQLRAEKEEYDIGIKLQKTKEYMPQALFSYQEVFASRNKLDQILFGSPVIVDNPGTFNSQTSMKGHFYSGQGFLVTWDPIDFGLHKARITSARSEYRRASAELGVTRLDVAASAASAVLAVAVANAEVRVAEANVERFQVYDKTVHTLVDADLRAGSDASYADAQLADARNSLILAHQNYKIAMAELAQTLGLAGDEFQVDLGALADTVYYPEAPPAVFKLYEHPQAVLGRSATYLEMARKNILDKQYYPQLFFLGGMNFRGSGLNNNAQPASHYGYGLAPVLPNYNVGLMLNFQATDYFKIHQQKLMQMKRIQAERNHYNLILQQITTADTKARAQLEGAVQVAQNMPYVLKSATEAELSARTRYEVGLGTIAELAQAEQLLAKAQVEMAVAKVGVWQALLASAYARGDLKPFLDQVALFGRTARP